MDFAFDHLTIALAIANFVLLYKFITIYHNSRNELKVTNKENIFLYIIVKFCK